MASHRRRTGKQPDDRTDDGLWDAVAGTVQRQISSRIPPVDLKAGQTAGKPPRTQPAVKKPVPTAHLSSSLESDRKKGHVAGPADLTRQHRAGVDRATARKLQAGRMMIENRLDLHGLTQRQAFDQLHHFILSSVHRQMRTVLIITGKGLAGQGVLRQNLPVWLNDPALSRHIIAFSAARPVDGGAGAFYVQLRRKRETR